MANLKMNFVIQTFRNAKQHECKRSNSNRAQVVKGKEIGVEEAFIKAND
jgi:hypothetical protein